MGGRYVGNVKELVIPGETADRGLAERASTTTTGEETV
jgi:hypothetical protein